LIMREIDSNVVIDGSQKVQLMGNGVDLMSGYVYPESGSYSFHWNGLGEPKDTLYLATQAKHWYYSHFSNGVRNVAGGISPVTLDNAKTNSDGSMEGTILKLHDSQQSKNVRKLLLGENSMM